jgi:hypothetical protein
LYLIQALTPGRAPDRWNVVPLAEQALDRAGWVGQQYCNDLFGALIAMEANEAELLKCLHALIPTAFHALACESDAGCHVISALDTHPRVFVRAEPKVEVNEPWVPLSFGSQVVRERGDLRNDARKYRYPADFLRPLPHEGICIRPNLVSASQPLFLPR